MSSALESDRRKSINKLLCCCFFHSFERFNYFRTFSNQFSFPPFDKSGFHRTVLSNINDYFPRCPVLKAKTDEADDMHTIRKDTSAKNEFRAWLFAVAI